MDSLINTFFDLWGINLSTELRNAIVAIFSIFTMLALLYLILKIASPRASSFRTYAIKYCSIIVAILVSLTYYSTLGIDTPIDPEPEPETPIIDNLFIATSSEFNVRYSLSNGGLVPDSRQTVCTNPITIDTNKNIKIEGIDINTLLAGFYTSDGQLTMLLLETYSFGTGENWLVITNNIPSITTYDFIRVVGTYTNIDDIKITYADISA